MGDRGCVVIEDTGVVLYTHWQGSMLEERVASALRLRERWNDPEYLARIIFEQMLSGASSRTTGFGIGTQVPGDASTVVNVDCSEGTVNGIPFEAFAETEIEAE